jgi:hypothetical protein
VSIAKSGVPILDVLKLKKAAAVIFTRSKTEQYMSGQAEKIELCAGQTR